MNNEEILMTAEVLSREKNLEKELIFQAIEVALATATRRKHAEDIEARVSIYRDTGDFDTYRQWEVIGDNDEMEADTRQIHLTDAQRSKPEIEVGEFIEEPLEKIEFGRIGAQAAKQVIMQKVREAERAQVVEEYLPREGEMMSGVVRRMERGDAIVDIGGVETVLQKSAMIPREGLRQGDRVRAVLREVRSAPRGPQLFLDRTVPELLVELFQLEVPEAGEGLIKIKSAARDPGLRAKIAVHSTDARIDPVGACVGIRGSRVQSVSNEINGERVDIIKWSEDPAQFVIQALAPAEVEAIVVDEDKHAMDVVVDETQLSQAIGRGGQNVRLASELTGWEINILNEADAAEKSEREAAAISAGLRDSLDLDEDVANILVQEGFTSLEEVAYVPIEELEDIDEFDESLVGELRSRAEDALRAKEQAEAEAKEAAKPAQDLLEMEGMDEETAILLGQHGIRTMEDLAECAVDEVLEVPDLEIDEERASTLIMTARAPWFAAEEGDDAEKQSVTATDTTAADTDDSATLSQNAEE